MSFDPILALREAGILDDHASQELVASLRTLTEEQTEALISVKAKVDATSFEVSAHIQELNSPAARPLDTGVSSTCSCNSWSGSGS
jgi:hypothetical protein